MTICINKTRKEPFTQILNSTLQSEDLSFDEVGFLGFLLSFPPDWQFYVSDIAKRRSVSKDKIYSLFQKLESKGYVRRQRVRNKNGTLGASILEFNEKPRWWEQEKNESEHTLKTPENSGTTYGLAYSGKTHSSKSDAINNNIINNYTPLCVPPQKNEREDEEGRTEVIENQPEDQFNIISITEDEGTTAESEKQNSNLVRFSENAKLTNEFHNAALSAGIHSTWIKDVFAKFREFWSKKQTVKSEKGWHQTWQSWCEKEFDSKRIPKRLCNESKPFLEDTEHLQEEPVVNTDDKDERISNVKKRMLKRIGAFEYRNWIEKLRFEIQDNSLKVYANTQFVADWVKRVYATTIKACSTFDSVEVIFALEQQVQQQQQQQLQAGQAYYAIDADPRIRDMRQKICDRLGAAFYRSNIERAKIEVTGNFMKIYVRNKHCVSYIERRLSSIYAALENVIGHIEVGIDSDRMGWKGIEPDRMGWKGVA